MIRRAAFSLIAAIVAVGAGPPPQPADPLTVEVHTEDADRFARIFAATRGEPDEAALRSGYLDAGSYGIDVFTPNRIIDANHLAKAVSEHPNDYATAIERCLPLAKASTADLRAIYLALHGVFPEAALPQIYFVFGAGNSGGTAGTRAQVLGLEVLCRLSPTPVDFRRTVRRFFAHETVHVLQQDAGLRLGKDALLRSVLAEGAADFLARLVTGEEPNAARAAWAQPREKELWQQLLADFETTRKAESDSLFSERHRTAQKRWVGNYNSAPDGWPDELGYWMGMRIWERYYAASEDKHIALRNMLAIDDPRAILKVGALSND